MPSVLYQQCVGIFWSTQGRCQTAMDTWFLLSVCYLWSLFDGVSTFCRNGLCFLCEKLCKITSLHFFSCSAAHNHLMHTCVHTSPIPAWTSGLFWVGTAAVDVFPAHGEGQRCTHHMYSITVEYSGMLHSCYFAFETSLLLLQNWADTLIHIGIPEVFVGKLICFGWTQQLCGSSWLSRAFSAQPVQSCFMLTGNGMGQLSIMA